MLAANEVAKNLTCFILRNLNFRNKRSIENGEVIRGVRSMNIGLVLQGKYDARLSVDVSTMFNYRWFFAAILCKGINQQV
jgi:hypothetical protein